MAMLPAAAGGFTVLHMPLNSRQPLASRTLAALLKSYPVWQMLDWSLASLTVVWYTLVSGA